MTSSNRPAWTTAFRSKRNTSESTIESYRVEKNPSNSSLDKSRKRFSISSFSSLKFTRTSSRGSKASSGRSLIMPDPKYVPKKTSGQEISYLEDLPEHVLDKIVEDLPASCKLCLRFTSKIFKTYFEGRKETGGALLGVRNFVEEPTLVRDQRLSFLLRLEWDREDLIRLKKASSDDPKLKAKHKTAGILRQDQHTCSACAKLHQTSDFTAKELAKPSASRRCKGSTRVLHLCHHATMTWEQFTRDIVNDFPYYRSTALAPTVLTRTYARNSGLSPRDVVVRHFHGSHCQSWEGTHWQRDRPVPAGGVSFQYPASGILWYSTWHIGIQHVWDEGKLAIVTGDEACTRKGPGIIEASQHSRSRSVIPFFDKLRDGSDHSKMISNMISRLNSLEIYICPHVTFSHPILLPDCTKLVDTHFAPGVSTNPICPVCGARINMYVQEKKEHMDVEELVIIIARHIGTGDSAMEKQWIDGTREATDGELLDG
ncbi:hypothetical protein B0J14DRAFT_132230 [Halenospora varia]|nr:hypothetical protein B0J14DRAFT_132230 [Halenospora varia]